MNAVTLESPPVTAPWPQADDALAAVLSDTARATSMARAALQAALESNTSPALPLLVLALVGLREAADVTDALAMLDQARQRLRVDPDARGLALLRHVEAQALRREGRSREAMEQLEQLHAHAAMRPAVDAFHTVTALGVVQSLHERFDDALASFYAALDLARGSGHASLEVNALTNLGSLQMDLYNLEGALPALRRSLEGAVALDSRRQRIFAAGNLVQCLCEMGHAQEALEVARMHLIVLVRPDDPPNLQRDEEIGHALLQNGLWAEARDWLGREHKNDVLTNPTDAPRLWLQCRLDRAEGDAARALARGEAGQWLIDDEATSPIDRLHLAELLADLSAGERRWREAYDYRRRADVVKDTLLGRAAQARRTSLQIEHAVRVAHAERDAARAWARRLEETNATLEAQMAANEALRARLEAMAMQDPLTGLGNRRHLQHVAPGVLAQCRRSGSPVAMAVVDLDAFKAVNDRHGHDAGDRVLEAFADLARRTFRAGDVCCRLGGEEFAILLPAAPLHVAQRRLQHLLDRFRDLRFADADGATFSCSFSAGVAAPSRGDESMNELIQRADAVLYLAKAAGRARVMTATDAPTGEGSGGAIEGG